MNNITHIFEGGSGRPLSPMATKLARYLMDHPDTIHHRSTLAEQCDIRQGGRSIDTYISEIRKSVGDREVIALKQGVGYAWIGAPIELVPCVAANERAPMSDPLSTAAMTREDVAKRMGLPMSTVRLIERRALAKLKKHPEILEAWKAMLATQKRYSYDPFHEVWLFGVRSET